MKKVEIPLSDAWRVLNPCPTVLVAARERGKNHVAAVAWCMPLDFKPPKVVMVLAAGHATADAVVRTKTCTINVPPAAIADRVMAAGAATGKGVDKFRHCRLTPERSKRVAAPGIKECLATLECRLIYRRASMDLCCFEVVEARVAKGAFDRRWLIEKGVRLLHHLGADGFEVSGRVLRAGKKETKK